MIVNFGTLKLSDSISCIIRTFSITPPVRHYDILHHVKVRQDIDRSNSEALYQV